MTAIRNVVFDIGWVLVHLDYAPITGFLKAHGADVEHLTYVIPRTELQRHETGALPGEEFLETLARLGSRPMNLNELRAHWNGMFELQVPMVDFAHRLASRYRVHLLSNVGDLHWMQLTREFRLHRLEDRKSVV